MQTSQPFTAEPASAIPVNPARFHRDVRRFAFDDDQEVPDTQVVAYEFPKMVLTFELTGKRSTAGPGWDYFKLRIKPA